jgi:hypothetical protein
VILAATTLNGCGWIGDWFSGKPSPLQSAPLRPGVDRQTTANGLPPAPNRGNYDAGVSPIDDNRNQPLGTVVATKGGQKAQLESAEKERAQREAEREKERVEREAQRDREKKEEEGQPKGAPPVSPPSNQVPVPASDQAPAPTPAPAPEPSSPPAAR